jgi:hypothetical protein
MKTSNLVCLIETPRVKNRKEADRAVIALNEGLDASTLPGKPRIISYTLTQQPGNKLVEAVVQQIKKDLRETETEALYELLSHIPRGNLVGYLPQQVVDDKFIPEAFYQPEWDGEVEDSGLFSFQVYSSKEFAQDAHPGKKILTFKKGDIEDPQIIDW